MTRRVRDRFAPFVIFTALALAPVEAPFWRSDTSAPPAAVLPIGEPTPSIATRRSREPAEPSH
jgi:hypothetical protein